MDKNCSTGRLASWVAPLILWSREKNCTNRAKAVHFMTLQVSINTSNVNRGPTVWMSQCSLGAQLPVSIVCQTEQIAANPFKKLFQSQPALLAGALCHTLHKFETLIKVIKLPLYDSHVICWNTFERFSSWWTWECIWELIHIFFLEILQPKLCVCVEQLTNYNDYINLNWVQTGMSNLWSEQQCMMGIHAKAAGTVWNQFGSLHCHTSAIPNQLNRVCVSVPLSASVLLLFDERTDQYRQRASWHREETLGI